MTAAAEQLNFLLAEATVACPRHTEASIAVLPDGRLLMAWSQFYGGRWGDDGAARIMGRWSKDRGRTWGEPFVLQENIGRLNCMSASLLQLPSGRLLLVFGRKDASGSLKETGGALLDAMIRLSDDGGRSWSEARNITPGAAYWCMTNDRLLRLSSGRLLYPMTRIDIGCHAWISDDDGLSWQQSAGAARPESGTTYEEPTVVELKGGTVGMFIRTNTGNIHMFRSADGGENWAAWKVHAPDMCGHRESGPNGARSPCMVKRVPSTGDLLLVWNNNRVRTPLYSALSSDEGESWHHLRQIEPMDGWPPRLTHSYPAVAFQDELVHLTYWETHGHPEAERFFHLRYRRLPVSWFYEA